VYCAGESIYRGRKTNRNILKTPRARLNDSVTSATDLKTEIHEETEAERSMLAVTLKSTTKEMTDRRTGDNSRKSRVMFTKTKGKGGARIVPL